MDGARGWEGASLRDDLQMDLAMTPFSGYSVTEMECVRQSSVSEICVHSSFV